MLLFHIQDVACFLPVLMKACEKNSVRFRSLIQECEIMKISLKGSLNVKPLPTIENQNNFPAYFCGAFWSFMESLT